MSLGVSSLRSMSVSHWKLLTHLKECVSKSCSNEKGILFVLSKEWVSVLQKLRMIYGSVDSQIRKNCDSKSAIVNEQIKAEKGCSQTDSKEAVPKEDNGYSLPQVQTGFKPKKNSVQNVEVCKELMPKWKLSKEAMSKIHNNSRTRHVIVSAASAETVQSRLKRLEDLASHLNQYPEARHYATKEGIIRVLLQMRKTADDEPTLAVLREILAVLGHVDPLPGRGIRILSIDGGGIRGVLVIELLKKLEELTGKRVYEMFDYVCGVSTGAILLCVLVPQKKTLTELSEMYKELSTKIFTQSAFWGTSNLVWSHSYYDTEMWEQLLKLYVGETSLMRTARDPLMPKDGGLLVNNPTAVALHEAKQLWPGCPVQCVVSFGTGRTNPAVCSEDVNSSSWKTKFFKILDSATDTEAVHTMLNDLLPDGAYFRFNPYVTEMVTMDEIRPNKIGQLEQDATMYYRRNKETFQEAAKSLMQSSTLSQKALNWIRLQREMLGMK
ncbi:hypothetical protein B7P43_G14677 [Cryptotermes secundus]|uniref:PNPLA domain-containing protein n=1 Tax=Cryptotermes secundus TaxID=105785 RepID=A0A2J7PFR3_9NEOP|nr:hypothetical protein B7P43_G14677 [Cryptotermes secundus]